jgi:hypothetical protein
MREELFPILLAAGGKFLMPILPSAVQLATSCY